MNTLSHARCWPALAAALLATAASAQPEPTSVPPQGVPLPDLTPGYVLIDGDIQIRLDQYLSIVSGGVGDATYGGTVWPGGLVPYVFNGNVSAVHQQWMLSAMAQISAVAHVTFRPWQSGDPFWIHIQESNANNSPVGMVFPGQIVNIFNWAEPFTMIHELYHTLGFWHEHTRPDRNTYVTINFANVLGGQESNFFLLPQAGTYGPYDFDSFMHYDRTAFSSNGLDTITVNAPWNAQWQNMIGQRSHFSHFDAVVCRGWYPFVTDRWWQESSQNIPEGTFAHPWIGPLSSAVLATPANGTLFIGYGGTFHNTTGLYTTTGPVTIDAPNGAVTLGN